MKRNYNLPIFIVGPVTNTDTIANTVTNAFLKEFPTYKEAELFALSGGAIYVKNELEISEGTPAVFTSYVPSDILEFGMGEYADGSEEGYIRLMIHTIGADTSVTISYAPHDSGGQPS